MDSPAAFMTKCEQDLASCCLTSMIVDSPLGNLSLRMEALPVRLKSVAHLTEGLQVAAHGCTTVWWADAHTGRHRA